MIVTDPGIRKLGFADKIASYPKEAGMESTVFDGVKPDPSTKVVEREVEVLRRFQPDWIVALGGGSSMDVAKAMWIFYERPDPTFEDIKNPTLVLGLRKKRDCSRSPQLLGRGLIQFVPW